MQKTASYLYREIAESLRRQIASGDLEPGDRLPPVREMAQRWNCTPGTVARAYAALSDEGLIEGHRGSGTRVTPNALQPEPSVWQWATLINQAESFMLSAISKGYTTEQIQAALSVASARWNDIQKQSEPKPEPILSKEEMALRFVGSHDLLISSLAQMVRELDQEIELEVEYAGSLAGLIALAQGKADLAGIHLWDEKTNTYNLPFVRRLLPGRRLVLYRIAYRSLGFILPPGNPLNLEKLSDLDNPDLKLVNRQPGSGTRVWFDAQARAVDIDPSKIPGYEREELTHLAVARAVAEKEANFGIGIYSAAAAYDLAFVPLTKEPYDLVFTDSVWRRPSAQALVNCIRSDHFKHTVAAMGGYDTQETGQETWIS
ncbi:MAG: GntR family transcriptional regulator [Anaerolineales bacterium]|nr:GntR family transcriptional regulator [Anaerolineales bacterium]